MDLEQSVDDAFRAGSRWSIASGPLVPREGQALMARTIAQKIAEVGVLVVEAGTGALAAGMGGIGLSCIVRF